MRGWAGCGGKRRGQVGYTLWGKGSSPQQPRGKATPAATLSLGTGHGHSSGVGRMAGHPHPPNSAKPHWDHGKSWVKGNQLCLFPTTQQFLPTEGVSAQTWVLEEGGWGKGGPCTHQPLGSPARNCLTCASPFWHRVA